MDEIKEILKKYSRKDYGIFKDTIDMLCSKGVGNGCYQDYTVLMDILSILTACESIVREN